MDELPRVELPADFVKMREASRAKGATTDTLGSVTNNMAELTVSDLDTQTVGSDNPQDGSQISDRNSSTYSDGLLIDDSVIERILDSVVTNVQASLSSELVEKTSQEVVGKLIITSYRPFILNSFSFLILFL